MNRIFNKPNGILLAGFLGGVLVVGLGSGIAFAEYMGFDYDDSAIRSEDQLAVAEFTYAIDPGERVIIPSAPEIVFDESVPAGTLLVSVEYNSQDVAVDWGAYESEVSAGAVTVIDAYVYYLKSDFEMFMDNKDAILQGLKDGKIVAIDNGHSFIATTATANPVDKDRVFANYDSAARALAD